MSRLCSVHSSRNESFCTKHCQPEGHLGHLCKVVVCVLILPRDNLYHKDPTTASSTQTSTSGIKRSRKEAKREMEKRNMLIVCSAISNPGRLLQVHSQTARNVQGLQTASGKE